MSNATKPVTLTVSDFEVLKAKIEAQAAQIAELKSKAAAKQKITFKVSNNSRCICVYGLARRPVSLYKSQALRLFAPDMASAMLRWIASNPTNDNGETLADRDAD